MLWLVTQRAVALFSLLSLLPLLVFVACLIRLESRGPIIFRQRRPGFRERCFTALKFRTMYTGSEAKTRLGVTGDDPRITRVGRILRSTRIDELPQLWNIVKGDMNFVGPRPIPVALDDVLQREIRDFGRRYDVRPGLTSLAQVCVADNGVDERLIDDWSLRFEAERRYLRSRSTWYDLIVIWLTINYVIRKVIRR